MTEHERLRAQKRAFEEDIAVAQALQRLRANGDFQRLVRDGFLHEACIDAVRQSVACRDRDARWEMLQKARSAGFLQAYFDDVSRRGEYARAQMQALDAAIAHGRHTGE